MRSDGRGGDPLYQVGMDEAVPRSTVSEATSRGVQGGEVSSRPSRFDRGAIQFKRHDDSIEFYNILAQQFYIQIARDRRKFTMMSTNPRPVPAHPWRGEARPSEVQ